MGKHCNHSCLKKANHSCNILCNYGFMVSELSKRIKEIRIAKGDSCTQAGAKVGISRQAYEKWENNATENMKLGNLLKFCDNYEVGIENLLRGAPSVDNSFFKCNYGCVVTERASFQLRSGLHLRPPRTSRRPCRPYSAEVWNKWMGSWRATRARLFQ